MKSKLTLKDWRWPLHCHLANVFGLDLVAKELTEIVRVAKQCQARRATSLAPKAKAVRKMAGPKPPKGYGLMHHPIQGVKKRSDVFLTSLGEWFPVTKGLEFSTALTYARKQISRA